jgi:hypothetical protein
MNTHTSEVTPSRNSLRLLRAASGAAVLGSLLALGSGCVVAVRPAPAVVYSEPADPGEVVVSQEPPAPVAEVVGVAPGPGFFWVGGYYHWYGNRWGWRAGHYERPPHAGARWVGPRYAYRGNARIYVRGYWR